MFSVSLTLILFVSWYGAAAEDVPPLEEILKRHEASLRRLEACSVTTNEQWLVKRADGTPEQILSTRRCELRFDGPRANLLVLESNYPPGTESADTESRGMTNEFNYVRNGQVLEIFYPHDEVGGRPKRPKGVNGRLSPQAEDDFFCFNAIGHSSIAFGMSTFPGPLSIGRLIAMSKNLPPSMDERGLRIEGTGRDGSRHTIWFDPESSYTISGFKIEQSGATLNDNRYQYNRRVLQSRFGFAEKAIVESVTFEIKDVRTQPWKDTHVITELAMVKTVKATDGTQAVERTSHTLTEWNLEPDFTDTSFKPILPVPEGERVLVRDEPSLEYAYLGEKIQLVVRDDTLKGLKNVQVPRSSSVPRIQWAWGFTALILAIVWWRIRAQSH